tara:strand:- start:229 stop:501 length:273 start_codon:yes stop_codon:yes gene_type:complete
MRDTNNYEMIKNKPMIVNTQRRDCLTVKTELAVALRAILGFMGVFDKDLFIEVGIEHLNTIGSNHRDDESRAATISNVFSWMKDDYMVVV